MKFKIFVILLFISSTLLSQNNQQIDIQEFNVVVFNYIETRDSSEYIDSVFFYLRTDKPISYLTFVFFYNNNYIRDDVTVIDSIFYFNSYNFKFKKKYMNNIIDVKYTLIDYKIFRIDNININIYYNDFGYAPPQIYYIKKDGTLYRDLKAEKAEKDCCW